MKFDLISLWSILGFRQGTYWLNTILVLLEGVRN